MVGQDFVEELTVDGEDVVEVVEVIQVLCHQITQPPSVPVSGRRDVKGTIIYACFVMDCSRNGRGKSTCSKTKLDYV